MKLNKESAELLAQKFRSENGLSSNEAINIKALLRLCNILTVYAPMSENACGLSLKSPKGRKFMLINCNISIGRQHFTIAHELFHLYYDENPLPHICSKDGVSKTERDANLFASALLMPKEGILKMVSPSEIADSDVTFASVLRLEQYFGTSRQSMLYRLKAIGLLSESRLKDLLGIPVLESAKQYGHDLSLYQKGNENVVIGDYGEKARFLYEKDKISEGHYLELLKLIENEQN